MTVLWVPVGSSKKLNRNPSWRSAKGAGRGGGADFLALLAVLYWPCAICDWIPADANSDRVGGGGGVEVRLTPKIKVRRGIGGGGVINEGR